MEDLFKKFFPQELQDQGEPKVEIGESITSGRLKELARAIKSINVTIVIISQGLIDGVCDLIDEFIRAESMLNSRSKVKLYRDLKGEILDAKTQEFLRNLDNELKHVYKRVEEIYKNKLEDEGGEEKENMRIFLRVPAWQRLEKISKLVATLERVGLNCTDLKNQINIIKVIISKDEYRANEGMMGEYD